MSKIDGYVEVYPNEKLIKYLEGRKNKAVKDFKEASNLKFEDFLLPLEKTPWYKFEWFESEQKLDWKSIKKVIPDTIKLNSIELCWYKSFKCAISYYDYVAQESDLWRLLKGAGKVLINFEAKKVLDRVAEETEECYYTPHYDNLNNNEYDIEED